MTEEIPAAICAYPIVGWRLDKVSFDVREQQPDGWIVSLHRERPGEGWKDFKRCTVVMARSDVGPREAWDEALRIAIREDERESRATKGSAIHD